jgi:chemotaxis protein histidine kinase CheA/ActR/RegA family two-component response regulator
MADRFSVDAVRDLFRDDVQRLIRGVRRALDDLRSAPSNMTALDELHAMAHSLKGTASLVGMTYLSRAGAVLDRVGDLAGAHLHNDVGEALAIFRQVQAAIPFIEQLLDNSLAAGDLEIQENLYTELLMSFPPRVRGYLHELDMPPTDPVAPGGGGLADKTGAADEDGAPPPVPILAEAAVPPVDERVVEDDEASQDDASRLDRELLDAFTTEAAEAIEASERLLLELERLPDDRGLLQALFRHFHTLKGAAAAVGLEHAADQLHQGEDLLEAVIEGEVVVDAAKLVDFLFRLTDSVTGLIHGARGVREERRAVLSDIAGEITALTAPSVAVDVASTTMLGEDAPPDIPAPESPSEPLAARADHDAGVRVQAARLDALMNQVGQLVVSRTRMDRNIQAFGELRDKLYYCRTRLAEIIEGFQDRYEFNTGDRPLSGVVAAPNDAKARAAADDFFTDLEFDKYDDFNILARSVIEIATDTGEIADQLGDFIEGLGEEARQFSKITSGLQRQITRLRLVPLDTLFRRLLRPVRDAARQEGKLVDVHLEGADVQLDKSIVEALYPPLLHMVRNSVSHGIEPPAVRQSRGKRTVGGIRIAAVQRHNSVLLSVHDDGAGLDFDAILNRARKLGLIEASTAPTRDQLLPLIFRPGFSTDTAVTELSGRGVGMDVVARDIAALNGSLLVDSKDGEGTTIRLALPTTTSIDEVLVLEAGAQTYVLPVDFVEQAVAVEMQDLVRVGDQRMLKMRNELLPVLMLGSLVGESAPADGAVAVLLRAGDRTMALIVDRVQGQQEVVIRPLGRFLDQHPFLSGATISGAGSVIFVLHVGRLFDVLASFAERPATFILGEISDAAPVEARAVLVVDDSISVRKLATRFLESEGIEVDSAVDGLDAMEKLATGRFCLVVTDLEMPRMQGYELIAEIRRRPDYQSLPVIVCSSRSSEKHRRRAREAGAQGYITKPFTKEQLLSEIERVSDGGFNRARGDRSVSCSG